MSGWSAGQYLEFAEERTRPARDLLAQVRLDDANHVVDLGCGPANSTELLVERFPQAEIVGVDSSHEMLDRARRRLPQCRFIEADIATWVPEKPDLIFANAVFQWVPDHVRVYEAVRARNPAAAQRAMTALLDLALLDTTNARRPAKKRAGGRTKS